jgi:ferrous iron transport protein A
MRPIFFSTNPVENTARVAYNRLEAVEIQSHLKILPPRPAISVHDLIPLRALLPGQSAEVRQVVGQAEQVRRLHELGLRDGTHLEMVRSGTPCIVRLGTGTLCFRDVEALQVLVMPRVSA